MDAAGKIYIADSSNHRIRLINPSPPRVGSFAQIASGGGWKTTITLVNSSTVAVTARVNFYADGGGPLSLPLVVSGGSQTTNSFADLTIQPRGSSIVESEASTPSISVGWADLQASAPLSGYAIFRQRSAGVPDSEGTTPLETTGTSSIAFFYDNTASFQTGVALANLSTTDSTIIATFRDENGTPLGSSQLSLPGSGHSAFFVNNRFSATGNRRGVIEFRSNSGTLTGVGLRFSASGSFTSVPIIR
jgi:hypothetical protein